MAFCRADRALNRLPGARDFGPPPESRGFGLAAQQLHFGNRTLLPQQPENRDPRLSSHKHLAICDYRGDEFIPWAKMVT